MPESKDNVRIAKNTMIVYFRLIITAVIGLVTSRYVLQILGASDFGLYSVIGGVIAMFTFISASMQATTVRFLNYEMGRADGDLCKVFNTARQIHVLFAVGVFVVAEVVGLYYIYHYLNVAPEKLSDATFVFHVSMAAACLGIINVPYQGLLVAHERFFNIAWVDIVVVLLKLLMVLLLFSCHGSLLRIYAVGMSLLTVVSFVAYHVMCHRYWPEVTVYRLKRSRGLHRRMIIFNGYTFLNAASLVGRNQGSNLLVNFFFGTVVNAAYTMSNALHVYVNTFAGCFDQAAAPQITQNLSRGNNERALYLVNHTCRVCILLVEIVFFAVMADVDFILHLWLGDNVPEGTHAFCRLTLLLAVVSATAGGLAQYIIGVGRLRPFTLTLVALYAMALLAGLFAYQHGAPPSTIVGTFLMADLLNRGFQLFYLRRLVHFPVAVFLREAYLRPAVVFLLGTLVVACYQQIVPVAPLARMAGVAAVTLLMAALVFWIGLYPKERTKIATSIRSKMNCRP